MNLTFQANEGEKLLRSRARIGRLRLAIKGERSKKEPNREIIESLITELEQRQKQLSNFLAA